MKKLFVVLVALTMAVTITSCATTQTTGTPAGSELSKSQAPSQPQRPGVVAVEVAEWTATVKSVDYAKKTVVLERDGKTATVDASYAKRLNEIKPGDVVRVAHIEELAIFVRKAEAGPMTAEVRTVTLAPKTQAPGGIMTDTKQVVANVEAIDYAKRTITLQRPDGSLRTFKVSDAVEKFDQIKKGDQVVLEHTEAIAISVEKP
jgi:NMD protein affecting ribosome stability and mRNA decay